MQSALSTKQMCRLRVGNRAGEWEAERERERPRKCAVQSRQKVCSIYLYSPFGLRKICLPFCLPFLMCFAVLRSGWGSVWKRGREWHGGSRVISVRCVTWSLRCVCFSVFLLLLLAMCAWVYALYPDATWPQVFTFIIYTQAVVVPAAGAAAEAGAGAGDGNGCGIPSPFSGCAPLCGKFAKCVHRLTVHVGLPQL